MATNAGLYKVQGPHGEYFAVYDPQTGRLWTERSEHAARSQASESGLIVDRLQSVTHAALMRLAGRDTTVIRPPAPPPPNHEPESSERKSDQPSRPIISRKPFTRNEPVQPILTARPVQNSSPFATTQPVPPITQPSKADADSESPSAGSVLSDDILNERPSPPKSRGKSPFADPKPPRQS